MEAGRARRCHARRGVLERDGRLRLDVEALDGVEVEVGGGLGVADVVGAEHDVEGPREAGPVEGLHEQLLGEP